MLDAYYRRYALAQFLSHFAVSVLAARREKKLSFRHIFLWAANGVIKQIREKNLMLTKRARGEKKVK